MAGKVSGRLVVFLLFGGTLILAGIVFVTGYRQRQADREILEGNNPVTRDSAVTPDSVRAWMARLPAEWLKVTPVEGQGFVLFVPCYSSNSRLALKTAPDSLPGLDCEYCDSLEDFRVRAVTRGAPDSAWHFRIDPAAGEVKVVPVTDSLLQRFPEVPFRDRLLLWIRSQPVDSTGRLAPDTMFFVPKAQENEFEVLRAEDENPEGCGGDSAD
jgi:hypothetical protein